jgi:hypothetical protein
VTENIKGKEDFMKSFKKGIADFIWCYNYYVVGSENNKIEEADLKDLLNMVQSGNFENGGATSYDLGGGLELPKVAYVIVLNTGASLDRITGNKYNSYIEFAESVEDAYKQIGKKIRSFINLTAFDENNKELITVYTDISDQKNTVKNFNPLTGNYKNLEKSLANSKPRSFKKYDWEDWLLSRVRPSVVSSAKNEKMVDNIQIQYKSKETSGNGLVTIYNPYDLLLFLRGLTNGDYEDITLQPIGDNTGVMPKPFDIASQTWKDILNQDDDKAEAELMSVLEFGEFPDLDFSEFIRSGKTTSKNQSVQVKDNSVDLIRLEWKFDNIDYSRSFKNAEKLIEEFLRIEQQSLKIPNDYINVKVIAEVVHKTGKITANEEFFAIGKNYFNPSESTYESTKKLIEYRFGSQIDFDAFFNKSKPSSVIDFDFTDTKIDVSNNPKLSLSVQKRAFELGWGWESNGGKTLDYNTFNYLYFTKTSISYGNTLNSFVNSPKREITEEDIFGTQNTVSPTSNQSNLEKVEEVVFEYKNNASGVIRKRIKNSERLFEAIKEGQNLKYRDAEILVNGFNSPNSVAWLFLDDPNPVYDWRTKNLGKFEKILTTSLIEGKYDWDDFFGIKSKSSASIVDNEVQSVLVTYGGGQEYLALNEEKLLDKIKEIWKEGGRSRVSIKLQPQGNVTSLSTPVIVFLDTIRTKILEVQPSSLSLSEIKEYLSQDWFSDLNFKYFFKTPLTVKSKENTVKSLLLSYGEGVNATYYEVIKSAEELLEILKTVENYCESINADNVEVNLSARFLNTKGVEELTTTQIYIGRAFLKPSTRDVDEIKRLLKESWFLKKLNWEEFFNYTQTPTSKKQLLTDLSKTKIKIVDEEMSRKVQQRAFELGWSWIVGGSSISFLNSKYLFFDSDKEITRSDNDTTFNFESDYKEIFADDLFPSASIVSKKIKVKWVTAKNGNNKHTSYNITQLKDFINRVANENKDSLVSGSTMRISLDINEDKQSTPCLINIGRNVSCDTCYDVLTDGIEKLKKIILSYDDVEEWDWSEYFEEQKTSNANTNGVAPKIVEKSLYHLDMAVAELEKSASIVAKEYNKEIYEQSLKLLYETKATYELALKFTPESAFMYERLDLMKKLAEIEKNIKTIEDMKSGGTFFMLAKILQKLELGENWKLSEMAQDVITNKIPQADIDIIIRSQKFKNWFGDWEKALVNDEYDNVSKALTNGIPSVYHHGARRIKYTYREVSNGVLYLAESLSYALWFSQNSNAQSVEGNYLTECFVNVKNPIDLTAFHVKMVDLGDLVRYIDAVYPLARIYDFIPAQIALSIKTNQPTNIKMWAWQLIRNYVKFVSHIKENTPYDGFLYYENNPSDEVLNPLTGQFEENVTKAVAIFKSPQVKVVDAVLFDGGFDDWRFENGGKLNN